MGYGGSCFPKDVQALYKTASENTYDFRLLNAVMKVNDDQKIRLADKIIRLLGEDLSGKTITMWGLAFKPNTDDIREAPALYIIRKLLDRGASIKAYDPEAMPNMSAVYPEVEMCEDPYEALENSDALAIVTEWSVFRTPHFEKMAQKMKRRIIFDGRNVYDVEMMKGHHFHYESIGREVVNEIDD